MGSTKMDWLLVTGTGNRHIRVTPQKLLEPWAQLPLLVPDRSGKRISLHQLWWPERLRRGTAVRSSGPPVQEHVVSQLGDKTC